MVQFYVRELSVQLQSTAACQQPRRRRQKKGYKLNSIDIDLKKSASARAYNIYFYISLPYSARQRPSPLELPRGFQLNDVSIVFDKLQRSAALLFQDVQYLPSTQASLFRAVHAFRFTWSERVCEFVFPLFASATSSRRIGRERLRRWPNSIRGTAGKGGREKFVIRQMTVANTQGDSLQVYFVIQLRLYYIIAKFLSKRTKQESTVALFPAEAQRPTISSQIEVTYSLIRGLISRSTNFRLRI